MLVAQAGHVVAVTRTSMKATGSLVKAARTVVGMAGLAKTAEA